MEKQTLQSDGKYPLTRTRMAPNDQRINKIYQSMGSIRADISLDSGFAHQPCGDKRFFAPANMD